MATCQRLKARPKCENASLKERIDKYTSLAAQL